MAYTSIYQIKSLVCGEDFQGHNATFKVYRNGTVFSVEMRPAYFVNSPEHFHKYLELLQPDESLNGNLDAARLFEFAMAPFLELLIDLAPAVDDAHAMDMSSQGRPPPEMYYFNLFFVDEKPDPRYIVTINDRVPGGRAFANQSALDGLARWTVLYGPGDIVSLDPAARGPARRRPRRVLLKDGAVECFYKSSSSIVGALGELEAYRTFAALGLGRQGLNACRVHGVVVDDKHFLDGFLLSYVDGASLRHVLEAVHEEDPGYPSPELRREWMRQLDDGVAALHGAGLTWGGALPENVMIDKEGKAWLTEFSGHWVEGWVDEELYGTAEGDLMGLFKIWKLLFPAGAD